MMLTAAESAGVEASIKVLGENHPVSIRLREWLDEFGTEPAPGPIEEVMDGVQKGMAFCREHGIACVNPVNVKRYVQGCEDQPKAVQGAVADPENGAEPVGNEIL